METAIEQARTVAYAPAPSIDDAVKHYRNYM